MENENIKTHYYCSGCHEHFDEPITVLNPETGAEHLECVFCDSVTFVKVENDPQDTCQV